jgi:hypothetical protein
MQFDGNRLVIRERGLLDQFDLALFVIRAYAGPLILALAAGILPAAAFNAWLLFDLVDPRFNETVPTDYLIYMFLLIIWEIPLATAPATLYLGVSVFQANPSPAQLAKSFLQALPQLIWHQVIVRALFVPLVISMALPCTVCPYLNEVILLERTPLRSREGQPATYRRSKFLHSGNFGDLFARWVLALGSGALLCASLWFTLEILAGLLFHAWGESQWDFVVFYPLAMWVVVGYFAVVRFLGYLDLRIRREGWEVELRMRAEGARLSRQLT